MALLGGLGLGLVVWLGTAPLFAQGAPAADLARRLGCFACHAAGPGHAAASLIGVGSPAPAKGPVAGETCGSLEGIYRFIKSLLLVFIG